LVLVKAGAASRVGGGASVAVQGETAETVVHRDWVEDVEGPEEKGVQVEATVGAVEGA